MMGVNGLANWPYKWFKWLHSSEETPIGNYLNKRRPTTSDWLFKTREWFELNGQSEVAMIQASDSLNEIG